MHVAGCGDSGEPEPGDHGGAAERVDDGGGVSGDRVGVVSERSGLPQRTVDGEREGAGAEERARATGRDRGREGRGDGERGDGGGVGHVDGVPGGCGDGGEPEPGDHGGTAERGDDGGGVMDMVCPHCQA
eukprot:136640-Hanusia_phi.AAC.1